VIRSRDRLIEHELVRALFGQVMQQAKEAQLLSSKRLHQAPTPFGPFAEPAHRRVARYA
jgi:hypothetical protein